MASDLGKRSSQQKDHLSNMVTAFLHLCSHTLYLYFGTELDLAQGLYILVVVFVGHSRASQI